MKKIISWQWWFCGIIVFSFQVNAQNSGRKDNRNPDNLPVIPVGLDAYRMWEQWPSQRIGVRAYMRSTYQRTGTGSQHKPDDPGYRWGDASHFLFFTEKYNATLDVKGMGVSYFFRANHWHGSPWNFIVDGKDNIVKETGTSDPVNAKRILENTDFVPSEPLPPPLNYTWSTTKGADLIWTPMPFEESFRIAYSRTHMGTGYYIYHLFADKENLSQPIRSWDLSHVPDKDVLDLISRAGTDIAPKDIKKKSGKLKLNKERILLANIRSSPSTIRAFKLTLPLEKAIGLERLHLLVTWDGAEHPSIDAPLCLFFGAGTLYNRDEKEYLVKGFPINIRYDYDNNKVELACYFPMPFFKSAKFEIAGINPDGTEIDYEIRYEPLCSEKHFSSYFHATYKDFPKPELGKDMVFLNTKGIEGQKEWSGSFVGTSFIFSHDAVLRTLEGDPRFFFDDSNSPQAYGTGTEEWAGGGYYWGGKNMTLPFAGHPVGAPGKDEAENKKDLIQSAYRFLLADLMPFGRCAMIRFEHGENFSQEHYEAVTYWYGLPAPSLMKTDSIDIGNLSSEESHSYASFQASKVETITSRWDGSGIDVFPAYLHGVDLVDKFPGYKEKVGKKVYPAYTKNGRHTRGTSEFTVKLDPENVGVLLRRTLDYSFPNQTAEVYIADASTGQTADEVKWDRAGIWYLAGSTTHMFSFPRGEGAELANRIYDVQTSRRRFREDEFLIPSKLTEGRSAIRVRIKFVPNDQELYPGFPFPKKSAWSELQYDVYSYIIPEFTIK